VYVVATAGHVDHGKSTLVRALTGIEPDRWAEERRRGLTIDLGFAWTTLPSGSNVAFVDVPGHERFLGNMLAGIGPAPVVLFVVAVDEGWRAQSGDHRDALAALGIEHGLVVLSRADLAPRRVDEVRAQVGAELADTGLGDAPVVVVSAATGDGLDELRAMLDTLLAGLPAPSTTERVRLWVDRSFSITGAGTVVTGSLAAGTIRVGDQLDVLGEGQPRRITVRGLQSEGEAHDTLGPVTRVAVNVRGAAADEVRRGDALVTPGAWWSTGVVDVRRVSGRGYDDVPVQLTAHVGTVALRARLRPLDDDHARLTLDHPLPLAVGDRIVLREPGSRIVGGARVLDPEPPAFTRRGEAARRAAALRALPDEGDVATEVARRAAVRADHLPRLGLSAEPPDGVLVEGAWWVDATACAGWARRLHAEVERVHRDDPLAIGLSRRAACDLTGVLDDLLDLVARQAGLEHTDGHLRLAGRADDLGSAEAAVVVLEERLRSSPFLAPEAEDLVELGLGARELAAAERAGRLLRLGEGVVVLPLAPALAMRTLATLAQPFTTSEARRALGTTRRVVIPLLEHLDARGWTWRVDATHREIVRG